MRNYAPAVVVAASSARCKGRINEISFARIRAIQGAGHGLAGVELHCRHAAQPGDFYLPFEAVIRSLFRPHGQQRRIKFPYCHVSMELQLLTAGTCHHCRDTVSFIDGPMVCSCFEARKSFTLLQRFFPRLMMLVWK